VGKSSGGDGTKKHTFRVGGEGDTSALAGIKKKDYRGLATKRKTQARKELGGGNKGEGTQRGGHVKEVEPKEPGGETL